MSINRSRTTETIIYLVLWLIAIGLYLLDIMRNRAQMSLSLVDMSVVSAMIHTFVPFLILFLINNNILIPKLLLRNKILPYFMLTACVVIFLWIYQYLDFINVIHKIPDNMRPAPHHRMRPLLPLPLLMDFTYALLVVGCNLAVALMFQRFDDKLEKESLMKANAENQLAYLKAQINPHFYMNMLNNIHGMIEINPEKAQSMVIDMSHLMRYMLYESSKPMIRLSEEIAFLRNYLSLMRLRFPEKLVSMTSHFPDDASMTGVSLPPLLFLVFIENAFKHGVSYRDTSFIAVSMEVNNETIHFSCMNSNHAKSGESLEHTGIGLNNIRQRLSLIYGEQANLELTETATTYTVNLTLPIQCP
ncbi:MAG: histidine kinase [Muribaculum sp.]|nr:histidine kinase [Muribaculum sp.]